MAFNLAYTADEIIEQVLTMLNVIPAGGTVDSTQEEVAEIALQSALHFLDSTNLYTGNTKETTVSVSANAFTADISAVTGIHSILGGVLYTNTPKVYYPIELVPAQKLGVVGGPHINVMPTKFCAVLSGQPQAGTHSKLILNGPVPVASTVAYIYRETLTVTGLDTNAVSNIPPSFLRMIILMMACDLGAAFQVDPQVRQEFRSLLQDVMSLSLSGAAGIEPGPTMRGAAAGQGTLPPPTYQGTGIP